MHLPVAEAGVVVVAGTAAAARTEISAAEPATIRDAESDAGTDAEFDAEEEKCQPRTISCYQRRRKWMPPRRKGRSPP